MATREMAIRTHGALAWGCLGVVPKGTSTRARCAWSWQGLLSAAEDAGVFSTLENLGAFSLIEKSLPLVEKLGLLSLLEEAVDTEAGLIFTGANFLIASGPVLLVLQICGFFPQAKGIVVLPEVAFVLGTTALGAALFALAFTVSVLQDDDQDGIKLFK